MGEWLENLDAKPNPLREKIFWTIDRTLGLTCYISGWFMPMYFVGRLESQKSVEYEDAAVFAEELEMHDCVHDLLDMATSSSSMRFFPRDGHGPSNAASDETRLRVELVLSVL